VKKSVADNKRKKTVCRVTYVIPDLHYVGGIQIFAKTAAQSLGASNSVRTIDWHSPLSLLQKGLVFFAPPLIGERLYTSLLQRHSSYINLKDCDVVHFWHVKAAMSMAESMQKPYIITCHGSEIMRPRIKSYQFKLFLKTLQGATAITAASNFTKDYLINHYDLNKEDISVICPGIDLSLFKDRNKKTSTHTPVIGTLSRIGGRKNIKAIIDALELLYSRNVEFKFLLAGVGPVAELNLVLNKLKLSHFPWEYLGKISDQQKVHDFYPSLNVFVLAPVKTDNDVEGFGIVFLEANASGVPVVASRTGGIIDAVMENSSGLFANPLDSSDIADKLTAVLKSNKDWRKSSRQWAEKFSQKQSAAQFSRTYTRVIENTRRRLESR
jgi:phosphatidylinositol alpha-1,6-mannosyltransferase